ncbi:GDSL-like Lipase/Acylhydrolase superfamily protein [Perilla frutescens var. hirtella]|uniref:GDSL-like Lipase/Acylhydrolase superfamily protein n=1 Tax=Perilla frutescens var. hirtella TaxID=608512 RepID=A0AAD4JII6_PERFH|nr:GDSL-like Lipase/Acylhydrolase superfamily protein [Perilla frutescens var. hirtella]KAH6834066.1 GDSL-like Lipase/Acylhydrolase superfamily protein [Perilla frutescens var. hirtella]
MKISYACTSLLLLFLTAITATTTTAKVPAIIVFGDSSVDAGNNNQIPTIARSNFLPYGRDFAGGKATGRFSNGRIATDFISEAFGLRPTVPAYLDPAYNISDFAVGVTFASAGTGYDNATSDVLGVIPLWKELEYYKEYQKRLRAYLGDWKAIDTISKALYIISIGTNDFLENYYSFTSQRRTQYTVDAYQLYLIGIAKKFVVSLHGLGARKISLGGLPPMGCMPLERAQNLANGNGCMETYNIVAMSFNQKLYNLVRELNKEIPGLNLVFSNPYYALLQIIQKPSKYGFDVSQRACCATGMFEMGYACQRSFMTCTDANKYVFWDAFHPSEQTNRIVADHVLNSALYKFK